MKIQIIKHEKKRFTELGALESQMQALKTHLKNGRRFATDGRPWFIVLGEATTQQDWLNSLNLELAWQSARNLQGEDQGVDIYCAKDAVFFLPAESFWQAEAAPGLLSKWQSFLRLFHRQRSFKAPQGIVVCIPLDLLQNAEKREIWQNKLQTALKESAERYFGKIPVYLIITGLHQLEGFTAYIHKIRPEQKEQIFGFSQGRGRENQLKEADRFRALHQQLQEKLLAQLAWDGPVAKNSEVFFFPEQLAAFYPALLKLCQHITHASPNLHRLLLRGVYFTAQDENAKTCFSKAIVSDAILPDSKIFSAWQQFDEWLNIHRRRVLLGLTAGTIMLLSVWWLGVLHDKAYLDQINTNLISMNAGQNALTELQSLQQLYNMSTQNDRFMIRFLGIFFPDQVYNTIREKYIAALQNHFEPMMADALNVGLGASLNNAKTTGLSDIDLLNQDAAIYNWLSSYLMLNELNHFDPHSVRNMLMQAWQNDPLLQAKMSLYDGLVRFGLIRQNIDEALVAQARAILGNQPIEIRAFFALKASADISPVLLGGSKQNLFNFNAGSSIDGFYTLAASKHYLGKNEQESIKKTLEESWVLGDSAPVNIDEATVNNLQSAVNQFYWSQYFSTWQNTLAGITVRPFASITAAQSFLSTAGQPDSAFSILWQQMAANLQGIATGNNSPNANVNAFAGNISAYLQNAQNKQNIINVLNQLGKSLAGAQSDEGSLTFSVNILNQQVATLNQLQQLATSSPQPVQNILNSMMMQVIQVVFNTAQHALINRWQNEVAKSCQRVIGNSGSFTGITDANVSLDNFSRFFSQNGAAGQFINDHLDGLFSIINGQIQNRSAYGVTFRLPALLQENIVKLLLIRNAFFSTGSAPGFTVSFTPLYLSKNLAEFSVTDGTQTLFYQNGPRILQTFSWPANAQTVVMKFTGLNGQTLTQSYPGQWGLVKFLNSAAVTVVDPTHYALTFALGNYSASYEVSLSNGNFAGILALQNFGCY